MFGIIRFPNEEHPAIAKGLREAISDAVTIDQLKARNPLRIIRSLDRSWAVFLNVLTDNYIQRVQSRTDPFHHCQLDEVNRSTRSWVQQRLTYELRSRNILSLLRSARLRAGVAWNGQIGNAALVARAFRHLSILALYAELSPFKGRFFLDHLGVNAASSLQGVEPASLKEYSDEGDLFERLKLNYTGRRLSDATFEDPKSLPRSFVFAPLQVPTDTQIMVHGGAICRQSDYIKLLGEVVLSLPSHTRLVVKPHPQAPYRPEYLREAIGPQVIFGAAYETRDLLERCIAVVTVNSSVGPDAFLFDKPVLAVGDAPWIKPGLALKVGGATQLCNAIAGLPSFDRTLRQRFLAHWYHAYTCAQDANPDYIRRFVEHKISLAALAARSDTGRNPSTAPPITH